MNLKSLKYFFFLMMAVITHCHHAAKMMIMSRNMPNWQRNEQALPGYIGLCQKDGWLTAVRL